MAKAILTPVQRETALSAIRHRASIFPRDKFIAKLTADDEAYHLGQRKEEDNKNNQSDAYSRFQELDNGLVREVAEAYSSYLVNIYLSKSKIFSMTSVAEKKDIASKFNVLFGNQAKHTQWGANLTTFFTNCAKYNFGVVETEWASQLAYGTSFDRTNPNVNPQATRVVWRGNKISNIDPYNCIFDHRVNPNQLHYCGEFAGYINLHSMVGLYELIAALKTDPDVAVYDTPPVGNPDWSIYKLAGYVGSNKDMDYRETTVVPLGQENKQLKSEEVNWLAHTSGHLASIMPDTRSSYTVTTMYLKVLPEVYKFPLPPKGVQPTVELWKFWVLDGSYLLASKRMDNAHGMLPMVVGQMDVDSLKWNTTGPAQVAIPYKKTAKQMSDRVLAGADRAIRDRGIYDPRFIDKDAINSSIPDAKIPLKASTPSNRGIDSIYRSMPFSGDTTALMQNIEVLYTQGMRASGINNSQAGQFTKGNRTLEEYNDIQSNAVSKMFIRALQLESTAITAIKTMLKLNVLQYQTDIKLYDPEDQTTYSITRQDLYAADVDFALADGLMPTEYMVSPNVMQQFMQMATNFPQAFQKYDVGGMIIHLMEQSMGVNLQQYALKQGQQPAMPPAQQPAPGAVPNGQTR